MRFEADIIAHVFDCDGVLLDSNQAKIEALSIALKTVGCPDNFICWAAQEFRRNFGRTRKKHFDVFQNFKGIPNYHLGNHDAELAAKIYTDQVVDLYAGCDVISESLDYLAKIYDQQSIYVVSASNEIELKTILPSRIPAISTDNIYGGPTSKIDNINRLLRRIPCKQMMFYGDAIQDAKASIATGIPFIGLSKYSADSRAFEKFCVSENLNVVGHLNEVSINA